MRWSVVQCGAVWCSVLQCVALVVLDVFFRLVSTGVLQCMQCDVLHCIAVCCSVLQCVAVWCSVLQCFALIALDLLFHLVSTSVLQRIAMSCSVLQCAAA